VGTPQGSASPLLANVYLHYALDRWVRQWPRQHARGDMVIVGFADDFVTGVQHQSDARQHIASSMIHIHVTRVVILGVSSHHLPRRNLALAASKHTRQKSVEFAGQPSAVGKSRENRGENSRNRPNAFRDRLM